MRLWTSWWSVEVFPFDLYLSVFVNYKTKVVGIDHCRMVNVLTTVDPSQSLAWTLRIFMVRDMLVCSCDGLRVIMCLLYDEWFIWWGDNLMLRHESWYFGLWLISVWSMFRGILLQDFVDYAGGVDLFASWDSDTHHDEKPYM